MHALGLIIPDPTTEEHTMIQILSRVPGELTLFETDDPAAAVQWVADLHADPAVVSIIVDYVEV